MPKLTTSEIQSILKREKDEALGVNTADLSEDRKKAIDYYLGDMKADMPSMAGRSSAVSTDVADAVEGLLPNLMEIFASGEEVVRFEPVGPEDEAGADQETDYVNHVFMQKNTGFLILYSFIKDALLSKVGIVKVYWDTFEREERETYENQTQEAYTGLISRPDVTVVSEEQTTDPETGEPSYTVTLTDKKSYAYAKVEPVPPEEFGISKTARCLRNATYCFHEPAGKTEADLIAQGYDADQVKSLSDRDDTKNNESLARDQNQTSTTSTTDPDRSMRPVRITEHYKLLDLEGNGKARLFRITTGGERYEILKRKGKDDIVEIDMMPFAAATPIIMTHRFFGRSVADVVVDIQRIKTALLRALLDNTYLANNQRMEVASEYQHERTLDDLLVNRPGGIVRMRIPGGLTPIKNEPIGNFVYPLIEYIDGVKEQRTGVSKQGQGIDANALQNQSATAVAQLFTAAQARMKLIARILAETGIRDLFSLLHATIRKNDTQINVVRLRNKWVQVDPRDWKTRDDMTINVGLGNGSREQQVQHVMMILGLQKEAMAAPQLGLVKPKQMYNAASKLVDLLNLKNVDQFFTDPEQNPPPPAPPDPKVAEAQGKLQLQHAVAASDAQLNQAKAQADIQVNREKIQAESEQKMAQLRAEYELKREQMNAEFALRREEMAVEAQLKREEMKINAQVKHSVGMAMAQSKIDGVRMGGEVG